MGTVFDAFPLLLSNLGVQPEHVLHVGAHLGEEMPFYQMAGAGKITLVEPIPELAAGLESKFPWVTVHNVACGSTPGTATLSIMGRTNLSTLAEPQKQDNVVRTIQVPVVRVDEIQEDANILVVDAQGLEIDVLKSADLSQFDLVIAECSTVEDSTMAVLYDELDDFMDKEGFSEANKWTRDYQFINHWGRGSKSRFASRERGSVYDVAYRRIDG